MKIRPQDRKRLLRAALGQEPCDLLIQNARLVNVLTGEIYPADVYAADGFIVHVESDKPGADCAPAKTVIDAAGSCLIPGFIDSHEHIESSMMTPRNFAGAVIPQGTTTVITDPHEIANVLGVEGVRYMMEASEDLPMRQLLDVLQRLVDAGNTVLVIDHNLDVIKVADRIIDLGPEGGNGGGTIVVSGTPEQVAACKESYTGRFLGPILERDRARQTGQMA